MKIENGRKWVVDPEELSSFHELLQGLFSILVSLEIN